jgi:hypothetical protein
MGVHHEGVPVKTDPFHPYTPSKSWDFGPVAGELYRFTFPNGYRASVARDPHTYGGRWVLWELALHDSDGALMYEARIGGDVFQGLNDGEVVGLLRRIEGLPERKGPDLCQPADMAL